MSCLHITTDLKATATYLIFFYWYLSSQNSWPTVTYYGLALSSKWGKRNSKTRPTVPLLNICLIYPQQWRHLWYIMNGIVRKILTIHLIFYIACAPLSVKIFKLVTHQLHYFPFLYEVWRLSQACMQSPPMSINLMFHFSSTVKISVKSLLSSDHLSCSVSSYVLLSWLVS